MRLQDENPARMTETELTKMGRMATKRLILISC